MKELNQVLHHSYFARWKRMLILNRIVFALPSLYVSRWIYYLLSLVLIVYHLSFIIHYLWIRFVTERNQVQSSFHTDHLSFQRNEIFCERNLLRPKQSVGPTTTRNSVSRGPTTTRNSVSRARGDVYWGTCSGACSGACSGTCSGSSYIEKWRFSS